MEPGIRFCLGGDEKQDGSGMEKAKSGAAYPAHNSITIPRSRLAD